jgi:hypothetical protein
MTANTLVGPARGRDRKTPHLSPKAGDLNKGVARLYAALCHDARDEALCERFQKHFPQESGTLSEALAACAIPPTAIAVCMVHAFTALALNTVVHKYIETHRSSMVPAPAGEDVVGSVLDDVNRELQRMLADRRFLDSLLVERIQHAYPEVAIARLAAAMRTGAMDPDMALPLFTDSFEYEEFLEEIESW